MARRFLYQRCGITQANSGQFQCRGALVNGILEWPRIQSKQEIPCGHSLSIVYLDELHPATNQREDLLGAGLHHRHLGHRCVVLQGAHYHQRDAYGVPYTTVFQARFQGRSCNLENTSQTTRK